MRSGVAAPRSAEVVQDDKLETGVRGTVGKMNDPPAVDVAVEVACASRWGRQEAKAEQRAKTGSRQGHTVLRSAVKEAAGRHAIVRPVPFIGTRHPRLRPQGELTHRWNDPQTPRGNKCLTATISTSW